MVPLRDLLTIFLRSGNLTFGGGDPTIAVLHRELVERRQWLSPEDYGLNYTLARVTPGTNLLAFCAGVGWTLRDLRGAVGAVLAVTVPSAVLVVWLTVIYEMGKSYPLLMAAVGATIAAAVGMMFAAALQLLRPALRRAARLRAILLFSGSVFLGWRLHINPVAVLAVAAAVGFLWQQGDEA